MPKLHEIKILPYSHKQLFDLVMDVEAYPKFLPFCLSSKIISNNQDSITAELTIKASVFKESYTSLIKSSFNENDAAIEVSAISGPFKYLKSSWLFKRTEGGTMVELTLDFELQSLLLNKMISGYLKDAYAKMIRAFEMRAKEIYD